MGTFTGGDASVPIILTQEDWEKGYTQTFDQEANEFEPQEHYFTIGGLESNELNSNILGGGEPAQCLSIRFCSNYETSTKCNNDNEEICGAGANDLEGTVDCSAENIDCGCWWDEDAVGNKCGPKYTSAAGGTCQITQDTTDTCEDDNYLSFNWIGTWTGQQVEGDEDEKCIAGGFTSNLCPALVQLPFQLLFVPVLAAKAAATAC